MNFLGHCYFSSPTPDALMGSLWPDFAVRPTQPVSDSFLQHFDKHQRIDKLTDTSTLLEPLRSQYRPIFRKTTLLVIDMVLDHYLAKNWSDFHDLSLASFAERTYTNLLQFNALPVPARMEKTLYWMTQDNWFASYATTDGLEGAIKGMSRRIRFDNPMAKERSLAAKIALEHEANMKQFIESLQQSTA